VKSEPTVLSTLIEKALREGATQASLADAIGVSQGQISRLRSGATGHESRAGRALLEHLRTRNFDRREMEIVAAVRSLMREVGEDHRPIVRVVRELARVVRLTKRSSAGAKTGPPRRSR